MQLIKTFIGSDGTRYVDRKRYLWLLSVITPLLALVGPLLFVQFQSELFLWVPIAIFYGLIPLLDLLVGTDNSNPPESVVPQLERDPYYRLITFALVPVLLSSFVALVWFVATYPLTWSGWLAVVINTGFICGYGINLAHEMGHKHDGPEPWLAKLVLSLCCYGHFNVEHNRGHHKYVATPEDVASSKMGESIYRFVLREMPGAFLRACKLEAERLQRKHKPWLHYSNAVLQGLVLSVSIYAGLVAWLGWSVLPFLLVTAFWGAFQLTSANYVEHYGLRRKQNADGRYERCQPYHSWNSNYLFSNWTLFQLQRHSDHHAHPTRRYQSLRSFDNLPELPTGYYGMFLVAYIPWLWYWVMDKRVIRTVKSRDGEFNILPNKQGYYEALIASY